MEQLDTSCCIVGGGPAGMMLGYLLARRGVDVIVLEKHKDFFRDFRGDTVHPSTLEVMREVGLLDRFLRIPHQRVTSAGAIIGHDALQFADFTHVPAYCKFIALMPQWDLLDFLAQQGSGYPGFHVLMEHEAIGLTHDVNGEVTGVEVRTGRDATERVMQVRAQLTVACDGRHSTVRRTAQFVPIELGVPIDVLWFRISRRPEDAGQFFGIVNYGAAVVLINRDKYFQAGLIVRKGSFAEIRAKGLDEFRASIGRLAPFLRDRTGEIESWDDVKLLSVQIDRLPKWHKPGLLCIGDAAHAMSPAGGVGINLAIQDAVAASNLLVEPLLAGQVAEVHLARVQRRRELPVRVIQFLQTQAHRGLARTFTARDEVQVPWPLKTVVQVPGFRRLVGYMVGIGPRPEHVEVPGRSRTRRLAAVAVACSAALLVFLAVRPRFR